MAGTKDLQLLIKEMQPHLNPGAFVFTSQKALTIPLEEIIGMFKEAEGFTLILGQSTADKYHISYDFVAAWITLKIHSALDAVGLTAAFSNALAEEGISCNVFAGYYHDHLFVALEDGTKAIEILTDLTNRID